VDHVLYGTGSTPLLYPGTLRSFFTSGHLAVTIRAKLAQHALGTEAPWVLVQEEDDGEGRVRAGQRTGRVVVAVTLTGIVRGPFLSANLGYWVDHLLHQLILPHS